MELQIWEARKLLFLSIKELYDSTISEDYYSDAWMVERVSEIQKYLGFLTIEKFNEQNG